MTAREPPLVELGGVSKVFCRSLRRSLAYGALDISRELVGRSSARPKLRPGEFWAVRDVTASVRRGACLGVVGPNGAGKSTLLKLAAGLLKPTAGRVTVRGRVGALIELGAGFSPTLSGRENVYVTAALYGFGRRFADRILDAVVDFAELRDAIDAPLATYSSGMRARLGFALAAQLDPDVLLVDEILAVGDIDFRAKCYNSIAERLPRTALVLVAHDLPPIARYATELLLVRDGRATHYADVAEGIAAYQASVPTRLGAREVEAEGSHLVRFEPVDAAGRATTEATALEPLRFRLEATLDDPEPVCDLGFFTRDQTYVATARTRRGDLVTDASGRLSVTLELDPLPLGPGAYDVTVILFDGKHHKHLVWQEGRCRVTVRGEPTSVGPSAVMLPLTARPAAERLERSC